MRLFWITVLLDVDETIGVSSEAPFTSEGLPRPPTHVSVCEDDVDGAGVRTSPRVTLA
jgi:hypothetical protein